MVPAAAAPAERLDEAALDAARQRASTACARRASAKARGWSRCCWSASQQLRELAAQAEPLVPAVVQRQQQRFLERWNEALGASGAAQRRARGAAGARAERGRRLSRSASTWPRNWRACASHLDEIERLLEAGGEVGKRLDFLIQELQREANTLGSKSAALELTNISVEMKVLIEQMREQVQNIE